LSLAEHTRLPRGEALLTSLRRGVSPLPQARNVRCRERQSSPSGHKTGRSRGIGATAPDRWSRPTAAPSPTADPKADTGGIRHLLRPPTALLRDPSCSTKVESMA